MGITLYQFEASHFNEKARWALDLKHVPHERVSLLPGPHVPRMRRLTGRTQTPALVDGDDVVAGSAAILAHLERRFPEPALVPEDAGERERAHAIAAEFDAEVGPAVRLAKFFDVMSGAYATETFCAGRPRLTRALYRATFPLVAGMMKRSMHIDSENAARACARTGEAFAFVEAETKDAPYLVGGRFTIADLTCAALLMPAVDVGDLGGPPVSAREGDWLARWRDRPGAAWVREIYRRHRRPD